MHIACGKDGTCLNGGQGAGEAGRREMLLQVHDHGSRLISLFLVWRLYSAHWTPAGCSTRPLGKMFALMQRPDGTNTHALTSL